MVVAVAPEVGQVVRVRGQQWVVAQISASRLPEDELAASRSPGRTIATLTSVSDDDLGEELSVVWEIEPGREIVPAADLPDVIAGEWADPQELGALTDAVRWGTVASADVNTLQSPFRSGIQIKDYQLEPVAKALRMPRVALLVADDVGLGKTIEAGLVVQEMLLRHRARRVLVVCPAPLTLKWQEEMLGKFGLDFTILDTAALKSLRRSHGLQANPFTVFPRMIISLAWLRTPRVQGLLREVLGDRSRQVAFFDLFVVDEAHHCAPPAPVRRRGYAVDSKQTVAVRALSEHSQHRLLLSATPHNGYRESWQALLELLDPHRFARGVDPDPQALQEVLVRRLKDEIVDADDRPEFAPRLPPEVIEIGYDDREREGHRLLADYARLRTGSPVANDLVTLLLKKRLFSSPAAFARTLEQHQRSVREAGRDGEIEGLDDLDYDLADEPDDVVGSEGEGAALLRTATALSAPAQAALEQLAAWSARQGTRADSKAERLIERLESLCRPGGAWSDERMVIFTEYRDTQTWLASVLSSRGLGGDRLGLLHGGLDPRAREHLKAAFQAAPGRHPVRILLATDSASEGIDLQDHCHRVLHYDIPFNPNRLEQRIGRVDRFGQRHPVEVIHFVGAGWRDAGAGSYEGDLEFLSRVAAKVATERQDLGRVNPVLAAAVEARMLGRPLLEDPFRPSTAPAPLLRAERDLREQVVRLREQLADSTRVLHVAAPNVRRVVDTALRLAGQPALVDRDARLVEPPELRRGWERTLAGLADPLDPEVLRPLTFEASAAGPDVVHAHLGHPLVAQATRLLRSAVWGERRVLGQIAATSAQLGEEVRAGEMLVVVFTRLVVIGADGARLHEEILLGVRAVPEAGRSRRVAIEERRYGALRDRVEAALEPAACHPAPAAVRARVVAAWPELRGQLAEDLDLRVNARVGSLRRDLDRRRDDELHRIDGVTEHMRRVLTDALAEPGAVQLRLDELDAPERDQLQRDLHAWRTRLDGLDAERDRERAAVEARYGATRELTFPFAVLVVAPEEP